MRASIVTFDIHRLAKLSKHAQEHRLCPVVLHGHSTHADLSCISCYSGAHVLFTCVLPVDLSCFPRCTRAAMSGYACSSHPNVSFVGTKRKGSRQKQLRKLAKGSSRSAREHIAQASCARTPSTPIVHDAGPAASATTVPEAPAVPNPHTHTGQTTGRWTIHQVEARAAGKRSLHTSRPNRNATPEARSPSTRQESSAWPHTPHEYRMATDAC